VDEPAPLVPVDGFGFLRDGLAEPSTSASILCLRALAGCRHVLTNILRLLPIEYFILLFLRMSYHQKCFKIVNKIIPKIHDFIL
jgi:hypothetical protein